MGDQSCEGIGQYTPNSLKILQTFFQAPFCFRIFYTCLNVPRVVDTERRKVKGKRKLAVAKGRVAAKIKNQKKRSKKSESRCLCRPKSYLATYEVYGALMAKELLSILEIHINSYHYTRDFNSISFVILLVSLNTFQLRSLSCSKFICI